MTTTTITTTTTAIRSNPPQMDYTLTLTDDCLLAIFGRVPLQHRLTTVPLVCRRWAQLQPVVRRAATSLTLISELPYYESSNNHLRSPFHLLDHQDSVTGYPDRLRPAEAFYKSNINRLEDVSLNPLHFYETNYQYSKTLSDAFLKRLLTELPNIRRLRIVQLNKSDSFPRFQLWSVLKRYARQLTSFDFHYLYYEGPLNTYCRSWRAWGDAEKFARAALSADFQRLLALINYRMPRLRHLLLNSEQAIFEPDRRPYVFADESSPLGSLYLPVLRRLASFSFKTGDHEDVLLGSLKKFTGGPGLQSGALKLRLGVPLLLPATSDSQIDEYPAMKGQLWKMAADGQRLLLLNQLDYLILKKIKLNALIPLLPPLAGSLRYLHLELHHERTDLLPLFTALSTSLPLLSHLHLNLNQTLMGNPVPADLPPLPPLPSVTSLLLDWPFTDPAHFGAVLQPARVFPALQKLTIWGQTFEGCCFNFSECRCRRGEPNRISFRWMEWGETCLQCIRPALKASLMQYPPGAVPLINLETKDGWKWFTVGEL